MPAISYTAPAQPVPAGLLPLPSVDHAKDGQLDPIDVPATGTTLRVPATAGTLDRDVVHIYWVGSSNDETRDTFTDSLPINQWSAGEELAFSIDAKYVSNNLDESVRVYYEILRGGQTLPSPVLHLSIGAPLGNLAPPQVTQAPTGVLDPADALQGVEMVMGYTGMRTNDRITPYWKGTPGAGSPPLQPVNGNASGRVSVRIAASAVAANLGQSVELSYQVSRSGAPGADSTIAHLTVQPLKPSDLPAAEITGVTDRLLDLNLLDADATVTVRPWPLIAIGQRAWCTAQGTRQDGTPFSRILDNGNPLTAQHVSNGLRYSLRRSDLLSLQHNSRLQLALKVAFDGQADDRQAHPFPEQPLLVAARMAVLPAMTLPQVVQGTLNPLSALGAAIASVTYPSMHPSDTLVLYYTDSSGNDRAAAGYLSGSPSQTQFFSIAPGLIAQFFNKRMSLHYRVIPADFHSPGGKGAAVTFEVGPLDRRVLRAAMPGQAAAGILDLNAFAGDALIVLESWFFMAASQRLWMSAVGTRADGTAARFVLAQAHSVTPEQVGMPLVFPLGRAELQSLRNGSALSFETAVNFDGNSTREDAVAFPTSQVTVST